MIRWLKDGQGDSHELPVKMYNNHELLVTPGGHVDDEPGSRKLYQLMLDEFQARKKQGTVTELLAELGGLKIPSDGSPLEVRIPDIGVFRDAVRSFRDTTLQQCSLPAGRDARQPRTPGYTGRPCR
jgi:hypothetical protein